MLFAALTSQCEYFKQYIKLFIALAPIARITHMSSGILTSLENFNAHELFKIIKCMKFYQKIKICLLYLLFLIINLMV